MLAQAQTRLGQYPAEVWILLSEGNAVIAALTEGAVRLVDEPTED